MGLEERNFFSDRAVQDDPVPLLRGAARAVAHLAGAALRRLHGHGIRRGSGRLRRLGELLFLQRGERSVQEFPVPLEGDDVSDIIERTATSSRSAISSRPSTPRSTAPTGRC